MKAIISSLLVVVSVAAVQAQSLRSQIDHYNQVVSKAMLKKDTAAMKKMFKAGVTPDFKYIEGGRTMSMDEMIAGMDGGISALKKVTISKGEILSLKQHGKTAEGVIRYTMGGIMVGPDKKAHRMMSSGVSKETYVLKGSNWKISKMVWGDEKMTLDGKRMDPSMMEKH